MFSNDSHGCQKLQKSQADIVLTRALFCSCGPFEHHSLANFAFADVVVDCYCLSRAGLAPLLSFCCQQPIGVDDGGQNHKLF